MPYVQPNSESVAPDQTLTQVAIQFMQRSEAFVARRVFPAVPVALEAANYFVFDRGDYNRLVMRPRAQSTESAGGGFSMSKEPYLCEVQAIHKDIDDRNRANQSSVVSLDMAATRYCATQGLLRQEIDWVTKYFTKTAWTFSVNGATAKSGNFDPRDDTNNDIVKFNDGSSTPVETVRELKEYVQEETGFMPNVMTLGRRPFNILLDHADIVGRLNRGQTPGGPAMANKDSLARLFELDEILVMDGIQNTRPEGQTPRHQFIGGKHALLSYRPDSPSIDEPSAGYTFDWTGYLGSVEDGIEIRRFREERLRSDRVEGEVAYDQKITSPDMGVFMSNIVD